MGITSALPPGVGVRVTLPALAVPHSLGLHPGTALGASK